MLYTLGSINVDYSYRVPHLPVPGETLAATSLAIGLGGKGANMSVAAARAGAVVCHIGAIGSEGDWVLQRLRDHGVDTAHVARLGIATGHAIILIDSTGENTIVIHPGANAAQDPELITAALSTAVSGDWLLLQNETGHQAFCAETASRMGMKIAYAAAPFDAAAVQEILSFVDLLVLNAVEMEQLTAATGHGADGLDVETVVVTRGAAGGIVHDRGKVHQFTSPQVSALDTTGAGDTFTGYLIAGLDAGLDLDVALERAAAAAALKVTRQGAADAIPSLHEVLDFMSQELAKGAARPQS